MMKRHLIGRGAAVLLSAGLLTFGGLTADAADLTLSPVPETVQAAFTADESFTVVKADLTENDGYDIISTDTNIYVDDDNLKSSSRSSSSSTKSKESKNWVKIILVALAVSVIGTAVAVIMIYRGYKYNGQTEPYEFKDKAPLELREKEDVLIDVRVTTEHIERDNK